MDIRSDSSTSEAPQTRRTQMPTFKECLNALGDDRARETCANCHRMVHVSQPWVSVEQLRALLQK